MTKADPQTIVAELCEMLQRYNTEKLKLSGDTTLASDLNIRLGRSHGSGHGNRGQVWCRYSNQPVDGSRACAGSRQDRNRPDGGEVSDGHFRQVRPAGAPPPQGPEGRHRSFRRADDRDLFADRSEGQRPAHHPGRHQQLSRPDLRSGLPGRRHRRASARTAPARQARASPTAPTTAISRSNGRCATSSAAARRWCSPPAIRPISA